MDFLSSWQDYVLTIGQLVLAVALIPSIFSSNKPSVWTSLITGAVLVSFGVVYFSMVLYFAAGMTWFVAFLWIVLFIQKMMSSKRKELL